MDLLLLYSYLKYRKGNDDSTFKKIMQIPYFAIIMFAILVICVLTSLVFLFAVPNVLIMYIPLVIEIICAIVLYFYTEHMQVKMSDVNMSIYIERCKDTYQWLKSQTVIDKSRIQDYRTRLIARIDKNEKAITDRKRRIDKWMQTLLIPITLAIYSALVREQTDFNLIMSYALAFTAFIITIYVLFICLINFRSIIEKREINQIQAFVDDLQGVIDTQMIESNL